MIKSMFKHSPQRRLGGVLAVVFSICLVAVTSASAAKPEFKGGFPDKFSATGASMVLKTVGGSATECRATSGSGTLTSAKVGTATLVLSECGPMPGACYTERTGNIKTAELEVVPVYISKAEKRVAFEFKPKTGTLFAPLTCFGSLAGELRGTMLADVTPINVSINKFTLEFKQLSGVQSPNRYENEKGEFVNSLLEFGWTGHGFEQMGWEGKSNLTFEHPMEIGA